MVLKTILGKLYPALIWAAAAAAGFYQTAFQTLDSSKQTTQTTVEQLSHQVGNTNDLMRPGSVHLN